MILTLVLVSLLCYGANNVFAAEIQLTCTQSDRTAYVEGVDDLYCTCYGPGDNRTTFEWSLTNATGYRQLLGICYALNNCTTFFPSDMTVRLYSTYSEMSFTDLTSRYAGTLTCSQRNSTFQGSANFVIKITRIYMSSCEGDLSLLEDSDYGVFCEHSPFNHSTVTWTIATHSGQTLHVGNCSSSKNFKYNCISPLTPNITLTSDKTTSSIQFDNNFINRDMEAVICTASFSDSTAADNCTFNIYHLPTVENCSLETIHQNWSLRFSCDVTQAFSTKGQYNFTVLESFNLLKNGQLISAESNLFKDSISYRQYLTPYTNSTDKRKYYRGRVVYTWSMLPYPGNFQRFEFQTYHSGMGQLDFPNGFNISLPIRPIHNCSDVITPCSCSTESLGSPAGRLLWLVEDIAVAIGDYGVKELLLPIYNLPSAKDVMVATCQLDWIQFFVAKKPVVLRKPDSSDADKSQLLTIVSWTMFCVLVVFDVVLVVILVRFGRFPGFPCQKSSEEPEHEVGSNRYENLKTTPVHRCSNKESEAPETKDVTETAST